MASSATAVVVRRIAFIVHFLSKWENQNGDQEAGEPTTRHHRVVERPVSLVVCSTSCASFPAFPGASSGSRRRRTFAHSLLSRRNDAAKRSDTAPMLIGAFAEADAKNDKPTGFCTKRANQVGLLINGLFASGSRRGSRGKGANCPLLHHPRRDFSPCQVPSQVPASRFRSRELVKVYAAKTGKQGEATLFTLSQAQQPATSSRHSSQERSPAFATFLPGHGTLSSSQVEVMLAKSCALPGATIPTRPRADSADLTTIHKSRLSP